MPIGIWLSICYKEEVKQYLHMSNPENSGTGENSSNEWYDSLPKTPDGDIDWDDLLDLDGYRGEDLPDEEAGSEAVGESEQQDATQQQSEVPQGSESHPDLPPPSDASR